jgi:hypothetical protein
MEKVSLEDLGNLDSGIERCIKSLGEKFLKWPYNFFTESDAHSFLYYYIFRSGDKLLKRFYPTKDSSNKTVLVHREYPTSFRYRKDNMELDDKGGRGHYDFVVLNPEFIRNHSIQEVIAKDFKKCCKTEKDHLLASIEFKLIVNPLSKRLEREIGKDFKKLTWSIEKGQARSAYMIIFNRVRQQKAFADSLTTIEHQNPHVKGLYLESVVGKKRYYNIKYLNENNWKQKVRYTEKVSSKL